MLSSSTRGYQGKGRGEWLLAGALMLGNGGTSGSIAGNVVNNGPFAINRSDTFTFGNVISGTGAFLQMGSGTTILTANNTYTGSTTVSAGTLIVNGSIDNSAVTVMSGAMLAGTGAVGATTISRNEPAQCVSLSPRRSAAVLRGCRPRRLGRSPILWRLKD
jgi:autotransporter-associated beta strand protein